MEEKLIVKFIHVKRNEKMDLQIPADLTANELVLALNQGLELGINTRDIAQCYLKATNPVALLKGNRLLADFGLHHGTEIWFDR